MKKIRKYVFLALVSLLLMMLLSSQANASWKLISSTGSVNAYLNQDAIYKRGPYTMVWLLTSYSQDQYSSNGSVYRSTQSLLSLNCGEGIYGLKALTFYESAMASGKRILEIDHENVYIISYTDITPDTIIGELYSQVC